MEKPNTVETCTLQSTPWVIPAIVLRFLTDLESEPIKPYWTIQKDDNGLSLVVKFPAKSQTCCSKQRNVPGKRDTHVVTNSSETVIPKRKKYKSPSTIRRNRLRRKAWTKRLTSARLLARTSNATEGNSPTDQNGTDSVLPIPVATPSHRDADPNDATNELETNQLCETESVTCEIHDDVAASDTSNVPTDSEPPEWGNLCAYCKLESREDEQFKRCQGCKFVRYCSKSCQAAHWNAHRTGCKILQAGPGCVT